MLWLAAIGTFKKMSLATVECNEVLTGITENDVNEDGLKTSSKLARTNAIFLGVCGTLNLIAASDAIISSSNMLRISFI